MIFLLKSLVWNLWMMQTFLSEYTRTVTFLNLLLDHCYFSSFTTPCPNPGWLIEHSAAYTDSYASSLIHHCFVIISSFAIALNGWLAKKTRLSVYELFKLVFTKLQFFRVFKRKMSWPVRVWLFSIEGSRLL